MNARPNWLLPIRFSICLFSILSSFLASAQCFTLNLTTTNGSGVSGNTLTLSGASAAAQIQWLRNGTIISTMSQTYTSTGVTVAGGNGQGSASNQLDRPHSVYVDDSNNIYIPDEYNHRIQKWAGGTSIGTTVAGGNGGSGASNSLNLPKGIYVDANGNIYIADSWNHRIQKWAVGSSTGMTVTNDIQGNYPWALDNPTNVYLDANDNIYIADNYNQRIQKWAVGANSGTTVAGGNGVGIEANQLYFPMGICLDANGNIYVADMWNHRIQKWTEGVSTGTTVAGGNGEGSSANQLAYPTGVWVDANGNIYVADYANNRIQKWAVGSNTGATVAGGNGRGSSTNQLASPTGVYVDANGNIYVADKFNHRIQKWSTAGITAIYTPSVAGTYTAIVTDFSGCSTTSNAVVLSVLAVELLTFNGQNTEGGNLLTWQTVNEGNNKGFEIQRQNDLKDWETIGIVSAKGKSSSYEFLDKAPLSISNYRLRQIDFDGKETFSKIISIATKSSTELKIYPSVTSQLLSIEYSKSIDFQIVNLLGQVVLKGKVHQKIDVSSIPQGAYILKIGDEQAKFLKQ